MATLLLLIDGFCCALVKPFGPLHEYAVPPAEERFSVCPAHNGPLEEAVAEGSALITAFTVAVAEHDAALVTVTVYWPALAVVTLESDGFCSALVKLFGPLQEYVAPPDEERFSVCPAHKGPFALAVATGVAFTVTLIVAVPLQLLASVTVTLYVPLPAVVIAAIEGFCCVLENAFGPFQE